MSVHDKRIIFENPDGTLSVVIPAAPIREGETEAGYLARIASKAKPDGSTQKAIIDKTELPHAAVDDDTVVEDYTLDGDTGLVSKGPVADKIQAFRNCWRWVGGAVAVNNALETEQRWARVRVIRNQLLTLSDGAMARENEQNGPNQAAHKNYRQALRDVPSQNDPKNVTWPEIP